jgi:hypothetical protein
MAPGAWTAEGIMENWMIPVILLVLIAIPIIAGITYDW